MRRRRPRCLILGSRQALDRVGFALDQALETLGLERAWPPDPADVVAQMRDIDVVLAEVSRPSPAVSFELGVATALGIPIVFCATFGSQVSPVFRPVITYDESSPAIRTMYVVARELEKALGDEVGRGADERVSDAEYLLHERFDGVVVHVDGSGGYVLIGSPGRRAAMLHVENMTPANAEAFRRGDVKVADRVRAEVMSVDPSRHQVQLRDVSAFRGEPASAHSPADKATLLIHMWSKLDHLARVDVQQLDELSPQLREDVVRWMNLYKTELDLVRRARNRIAHGESVDAADINEALEHAEELAKTAPQLPRASDRGKYPRGGQ